MRPDSVCEGVETNLQVANRLVTRFMFFVPFYPLFKGHIGSVILFTEIRCMIAVAVQHIVRENKRWFHIVFCLTVLGFLLLGMYLLHLSGFRFSNWVSAITDCFFFLFCIYTGRWLCNIYLKQKLLFFLCYTPIVISGLALIKYLLFKYIFHHPAADFFELSRDVMPFFLVGLVMGILLKFIRTSMQKELRDIRIQTEQKTMEFSLLQSQLSPHFLFNVLNNLYGISIEEHQRVPPLLLKLSALLRYSIYGAKKTFVPLKEELDYIQHYIEFEKIRISDRLHMEMNIEQAIDAGIKIAPLVLIVFVENAFKHARNSPDKKIFISISLRILDNIISFTTVNSYHEGQATDSIQDESSGLGLANTIKRLELLYGANYALKQAAENGQYTIELTLKYTA